MKEIKRFWNDFKKDFKDNKKNYAKIGIIGGVIYTLLGLISFAYLFIQGIGGSSINHFIIYSLYLLMIPSIIFASIYSSFASILPDFVTMLLIPFYIILQFIFGFFLSILVYYIIRRMTKKDE